MKKLNLMNVKEDNILNRSEMKSILAGSGGSGSGGRILCNIGGNETTCNVSDLTQCTEACVDYAQYAGTTCGGCAQFPLFT